MWVRLPVLVSKNWICSRSRSGSEFFRIGTGTGTRTGPGTGFLVSFTWGFFVLNICETGIRTGNHDTIVFL